MADRSVGLLTEDMLERFRTRAPAYDRENRFFQEDFDELKAAGYLKMAVPKELGGLGFSLAEVARETRRLGDVRAGHRARHEHAPLLGRASPPICGAAATSRCEWMLKDAAAGEVFAAGHAETGNDIPLLLSTAQSRARRRRLHVHRPQVVRQPDAGLDAARRARDGHERSRRRRRSSTASCRAARAGITIKETWDVLGMRATRSDDTVLEGAFVPDKYIARVVAAGRRRHRRLRPRHLRVGAARTSATSTTASRCACAI